MQAIEFIHFFDARFVINLSKTRVDAAYPDFTP
jgi:hypothetical protein